MRKYLLSLFISVFTLCAALAQTTSAQTTIKGKLLDAQTKDPLIGATITVKGTTKATTAALDGSFKITVPSLSGTTLVFSYVGYISKEVEVTNAELGTLTLDPTSASVQEVVVTANPSQKINRETPVAASSISQIYIEEKGAGEDFPELLQMTPGTTWSQGEGGYGDSRISIRGFSSNNTALLVNGIPMNDPQAGKIYWSDWSGLQDVTTSMQVQRGLSASTIATPAIGGSIDITTRSTEKEQGGTFAQSIGSYGEQKTLISYATGLNANGWATSFLLSKTSGTSYPNSEGTAYTGYNYFANVSKLIGTNQVLSFSVMGASQRHNQLFTYLPLAVYQNAPQGTRYSSDWGYLNGQQYGAEQNFYNKPLASINYNWKINSTTSWSTIAYGSWGTGAADYLATRSGSGVPVTLAPGSTTEIPRTGGVFSPIDFNALEKNNLTSTTGASNYYMQDVENDHTQYGLISSVTKHAGNITYLGGVDLRYFTVENYQKVADLLGGDYVNDPYTASATSPHGDINNPTNHATTGGKFNDDYRYDLASQGAYAQAEYHKDALTGFITASASETENRKLDYFHYYTDSASRETKWVNYFGYQIKGGANYNIDAQNNIYANIGYIQRPPLIGSIFSNVNLNTINAQAIDEKLLDYELGYGYSSAQFSLNVDAYRTTYKDRSEVFTDPVNQGDYINVSGLNELHEGIEADAKYRPFQGVVLGGMLTVANYEYLSNSKTATVSGPDIKTSTIPSLPLKGIKIGDNGTSATSAQTTAGGSLDIKVLSSVKVGAEYLYYSHYYASFNPANLKGVTPGTYSPYDIPDAGKLNLNVVYYFKLMGLNASFIGNVYNVLNNKYISEAYDTAPASNLNSVPLSTRSNNLDVYMGAQRYFMTTLRVKF
jgi:iron complex outermembrane receptor protein